MTWGRTRNVWRPGSQETWVSMKTASCAKCCRWVKSDENAEAAIGFSDLKATDDLDKSRFSGRMEAKPDWNMF